MTTITRKKDKTDAQKQATIDWYVKHLKEDFNINIPKSAGLNALKAAYEGFEAQKKAHEAELEEAQKSGSSKKSRQSFEDKQMKVVLGKSGELTMDMINHIEDPDTVSKPGLGKNEKWIWARFRTACMVFHYHGLLSNDFAKAVKEYNWD